MRKTLLLLTSWFNTYIIYIIKLHVGIAPQSQAIVPTTYALPHTRSPTPIMGPIPREATNFKPVGGAILPHQLLLLTNSRSAV